MADTVDDLALRKRYRGASVSDIGGGEDIVLGEGAELNGELIARDGACSREDYGNGRSV